MNYTEFVAEIENLLVIDPVSEPDFVTITLPLMITYAENRIYADLDLLNAMTTATVAMTANSRNITPPPSVQIIQSANAVTPSATNPDSGVRWPLQRTSVEFINFTWPNASLEVTPTPSIPQYFALTSTNACIVAPTPDAAYKMEFIGTYRPAPMSVSNPTTWIGDNLPELLIAASMSFGVGYQRDFGAQGSDPAMAQSWENQYATILKSQNVQMARQRGASESWQAFSPAPLARVSRT